MSRIAGSPVEIPSGVEVTLNGKDLKIKGSKGELELCIHELVEISREDNELLFSPSKGTKSSMSMAGTFRSLASNMVTGVSSGFEKALELQGVGYRAQVQGNRLTLTLGFSHPVEYEVPAGIEVEAPTQTQIIIKGIDKQLVGQVAADIRSFRPPEPYKGKGVRYANEQVKRKEAKKK